MGKNCNFTGQQYFLFVVRFLYVVPHVGAWSETECAGAKKMCGDMSRVFGIGVRNRGVVGGEWGKVN